LGGDAGVARGAAGPVAFTGADRSSRLDRRQMMDARSSATAAPAIRIQCHGKDPVIVSMPATGVTSTSWCVRPSHAWAEPGTSDVDCPFVPVILNDAVATVPVPLTPSVVISAMK